MTAPAAVDPARTCLGRWSSLPDDLVLLRESSVDRIQVAEREWRESWRSHVRTLDPSLGSLPPSSRLGSTDARTLRREHVELRASLDELHGLVEVVRRDGHGGNRQALGQYWRLLREAIDRHLRDEAGLDAQGRSDR